MCFHFFVNFPCWFCTSPGVRWFDALVIHPGGHLGEGTSEEPHTLCLGASSFDKRLAAKKRKVMLLYNFKKKHVPVILLGIFQSLLSGIASQFRTYPFYTSNSSSSWREYHELPLALLVRQQRSEPRRCRWMFSWYLMGVLISGSPKR